MSEVQVKLIGFDVLEKQLEALGAELAGKTAAKAARIAFKPVLEAARRLVPVDTGELRDSIKLSMRRPKGGEAVVVVGLKIGDGRAGSKKIPPAKRWHMVELGTAKLAAHPFLRPALAQCADGVLEGLKVELVKAIEQAIAKKGKG